MIKREITRELWVKYRKAKSEFLEADKQIEFHEAQVEGNILKKELAQYLIDLYKKELLRMGEDVTEE